MVSNPSKCLRAGWSQSVPGLDVSDLQSWVWHGLGYFADNPELSRLDLHTH